MLVDIDIHNLSHADRTSTPPVAFPSAHMELGGTREKQTPLEGNEQTIPLYPQTTPTSPGVESPPSKPSLEDHADILTVSRGDVDNHDFSATTQTCRSLCTSPHSRDEVVRPFHKVPQHQPSPNEGEAASLFNWQPPMVEDVSETQEEGEDSMEGLVFHVPNFVSPDPAYDRPVGSAISALMAQPQYQGWRGADMTPASNQANSGDGRVAGVGASRVPRLATEEADLERSGIGKLSHRKRKGERLEVKNLVVKRACIESPVKERLDGASGWSMLRQHPFPMGQHNEQVDGPRSIAATQEAFAFVHGSATDRDTQIKSGPLPQQGRDQPGPSETSQIQSSSSVPHTTTSRSHTRTPNTPPICLDFADRPVTFESTATEPPMQHAKAAPATMPTSPPPTRPITNDWPKFSPMFGQAPHIVREYRNLMNKKQTADCSLSPALSNLLAMKPASITEPSAFPQRFTQDVQLGRALQEPVPTPGEMGHDILDHMTLQTNVSPAEPTNTAFRHPSSIVDILPAMPTPPTCVSAISLPGQGTLETHLERLSKMTEVGAHNLLPESERKHRKRRLDTTDHPQFCSNEVDIRSPKAVLQVGGEKSASTRATQVGIIGHSQHEISLTDGHNPHSKGMLQSQSQENNVNPGFQEVPNKRICLGLDLPTSLHFAPTPRQPRGVVLIVELSGFRVINVRRETRKTVEARFKRHFSGKHGRFSNRHLQIVELDHEKTGAIRISQFFQQEDVLVFEHLRRDPINAKSSARKANARSPIRKAHSESSAKKIKRIIEKAVIRTLKPGSPSTNLHKYNLRPRIRR